MLITILKYAKFSHCLILTGNEYRSGKDLTLQRRGISGVSVARHGYQIAKDPLSRCHRRMYFQTNSPLEERVSKWIQTFHNEGQHCSPVSWQSSQCINFKLKASRKSHSYLSSAPHRSGNIIQREVYGLGLSKRKRVQPQLDKAIKIRVYYKSEEYDIAETKMDPLPSTEGTGEAILLEGNLQQVSPWWQQLPKRWVIVLLCFAAFLLCNMDRVSNFFWYLWFNYYGIYIFMFSMSHIPMGTIPFHHIQLVITMLLQGV